MRQRSEYFHDTWIVGETDTPQKSIGDGNYCILHDVFLENTQDSENISPMFMTYSKADNMLEKKFLSLI